MSDYPMLISNKLHSFRNFTGQNYNSYTTFISSDTWNWTTLIRSRARN